MEKQDHILKREQRVRLRDGFDSMYQVARSGAQGVVKAVEYDPYGYPCALIQWDTDHWTYDGEQDGWAFQSHFELVEDSTMTEEPDPELLKRLYKAVKAEIEAERMQDKQPYPEDQYSEIRAAAIEALDEGSEAFMVITVKRSEEDGMPVLEPQVVSYSTSPEGALAVEAQILILSSMNHESLISDRIGEIMKGGE